jgi:hypothetical protein
MVGVLIEVCSQRFYLGGRVGVGLSARVGVDVIGGSTGDVGSSDGVGLGMSVGAAVAASDCVRTGACVGVSVGAAVNVGDGVLVLVRVGVGDRVTPGTGVRVGLGVGVNGNGTCTRSPPRIHASDRDHTPSSVAATSVSLSAGSKASAFTPNRPIPSRNDCQVPP